MARLSRRETASLAITLEPTVASRISGNIHQTREAAPARVSLSDCAASRSGAGQFDTRKARRACAARSR
jgi:hypothetical protein